VLAEYSWRAGLVLADWIAGVGRNGHCCCDHSRWSPMVLACVVWVTWILGHGAVSGSAPGPLVCDCGEQPGSVFGCAGVADGRSCFSPQIAPSGCDYGACANCGGGCPSANVFFFLECFRASPSCGPFPVAYHWVVDPEFCLPSVFPFHQLSGPLPGLVAGPRTTASHTRQDPVLVECRLLYPLLLVTESQLAEVFVVGPFLLLFPR
jgi:hypothetical protein